MSATLPEGVKAFTETWKNAFLAVLTQLGAAGMKVTEKQSVPEETALDPSEELQVWFAGGESLKGMLRWICAKKTAVQCAQLVTTEPVDAAAEFSDMHKDSFLEFLRQVAGETAAKWKAERGSTEIVYQAEAPATFKAAQSLQVVFENEQYKELTFTLRMDEEMTAALVKPLDSAPETAGAGAKAETPAEPGDALEGLPTNLELILDVQLEATIRFGEREMLLQDVFSLMPGAVVELDQMVNDPAELLVAGRLVAKGEVVVVDGNFGLRVTEVVSANLRAAVLELE